MVDRFIMLGERNKKGRIVKNEQYSIDEFINLLNPCTYKDISEPKIKLIDLLFPSRLRTKLEIIRDKYFNLGKDIFVVELRHKLNVAIDNDSFGKKRK